nr:McmH [Thermoactinomyces sp.]
MLLEVMQTDFQQIAGQVVDFFQSGSGAREDVAIVQGAPQSHSRGVFYQLQSVGLHYLFRDHLYRELLLEGNAPTERVIPDRVLKRGREQVNLSHATLSLCGSLSDQALESFLTSVEASLPEANFEEVHGEEADEEVNVETPPLVTQGEVPPARLVTQTSPGQVHQLFAFQGVSLRSEDRYALHVACEMLNGAGGRFYYRLREREQLAYAYQFFSKEFGDGGYLTAYFLSRPDDADKMKHIFSEEVERLSIHPFPRAEMERAQSRLITRFHHKSESTLAQAVMNGMFKCLSISPPRYMEKIQSVTADEVKHVVSRYVRKHDYQEWNHLMKDAPV